MNRRRDDRLWLRREKRYLEAQKYIVILWVVMFLALLLTACNPMQETNVKRSESVRVYDKDGDYSGRIQGKRIYDRDGNFVGMIGD